MKTFGDTRSVVQEQDIGKNLLLLLSGDLDERARHYVRDHTRRLDVDSFNIERLSWSKEDPLICTQKGRLALDGRQFFKIKDNRLGTKWSLKARLDALPIWEEWAQENLNNAKIIDAPRRAIEALDASLDGKISYVELQEARSDAWESVRQANNKNCSHHILYAAKSPASDSPWSATWNATSAFSGREGVRWPKYWNSYGEDWTRFVFAHAVKELLR